MMSSASIPRSVRLESASADSSTAFDHGQVKVIKTAVCFCSHVLNEPVADYARLIDRVDQGLVLTKKDRRELQNVLNRFSGERLDADERRNVGWVKSDLWDAHRPKGGSQ